MNEEILKKIERALQFAKIKYEVCGAYRRGIETIKISMVVDPPAWRAMEAIKLLPIKVDVKQGATKSGRLIVEDEVPVYVRVASPETWGGEVLALTGNSLFNRFIRARAKKLGMVLRDSGLWFGADLIAGRTEKQIFDALGCKYLEPHERTFRIGRDGLTIKMI